MAKNLTSDDLRSVARQAINGDSQKDFADRHGLSTAYLSDFLAGRREPGQSILDALGYERVVTYRRIAR